MSFYPFENPIGFGVADFLAITIALVLITAAIFRARFAWQILPFAKRTYLCIAILGGLPVILRVALLRHHPIPTPHVYDEFGHLLVADTLRLFRLSNPPHVMHDFFETFFVLQQPTYSSIYPLGQGLSLAIGQAIFGTPWAGVLLSAGAFSALTYWMLRAWISPGWAFIGGFVAVFQFGPLCYWMNSYWGGSLAAAAGCLVFGALPRLNGAGWKISFALGAGFALLILIRPFESLFVIVAGIAYLVPQRRFRHATLALVPISAAIGLILLQNKSVTGQWTTLPYTLSRYQYGVPASLTFQSDPVPHRALTPQQSMEYQSQIAFRGVPRETVKSYFLRLEYRVRFYRFFFLPPLYVALLFFLPSLREWRFLWLAATILLFALGANFYPLFEFHYFAPITCLFLLAAMKGLDRLSAYSPNAALAIVVLCCFHFLFWYSVHLFDDDAMQVRQFETWSGINHNNPERRIAVKNELTHIPGELLILVRYSPSHIFQDEWVYNEADIDKARIVWARDRGAEENAKLLAYFSKRKVFLLEPDVRPPRLTALIR